MPEKDKIEFQFTVSGVEDVKKDIEKIQTQLSNITKTFKNLGLEVGDLEKGYKKYRTEVEKLSNEWQKFITLLKAEFRWIAGFEVIRGIENIVRSAWGAIVELDFALAKVRAATLASAEDMQVLQEAILKTATSSIYSFKELGEALAVIVRAGVSVKDAATFLDTASKLAMITGERLQDVAEFLISVQKVYMFPIEQLPEVANLITVALNQSKLALRDLIISWQYVAPTAKAANMSIKDLLAVMMVLSDKGLDASKIGTNLRQVMTYLLAPTSKMVKILEQLGIKTSEVNIMNRNFLEVLIRLREAGFDVYEAFQALGIRGATAFAYLLSSIEDIQKALRELNIAEFINVIEEATGYMRNSITGTMRILKNELAATAAAFGDLVKPAVIDTLRGLINVIEALRAILSAVIPVTQNFTVALTTVSVSVGATAGALLGLRGEAIALITIFTSIIGMALQLIEKFTGLRVSIATTTDAVYALAIAITAFIARARTWARWLLIIEGGLWAITKASKAFQGAVSAYGEEVENLGKFFAGFQQMTAGTKEEFESGWKMAKEGFKNLDNSIKDFFPTLKILFDKIESSQVAYSYWIRNQQAINREIEKAPSLLAGRIREIEAKIQTLREELKTAPGEVSIFGRLFGKKSRQQIMEDIRALEATRDAYEKFLRGLETMKQTLPSVAQKALKSAKTLDEAFRIQAEQLLQLPKKLREESEPFEQVKSQLVNYLLEIQRIFQKYHIPYPEKEINEAIREAGKDYHKLITGVFQILIRVARSKEVQSLSKEAQKEIATAVSSAYTGLLQTSQESLKAFANLGKEWEREAKKSQTHAERVAEAMQEINLLLQQEPYDLGYFNQLFEAIEKLRRLQETKKYTEYRNLALVKLIEFLRSEDTKLSETQLERLVALMERFGLVTEKILPKASVAYLRYIQDVISSPEGIIKSLTYLTKDKKIFTALFGDEKTVSDFISQVLIPKVQEFWENGMLTARTIRDLDEKFKQAGEVYGKDFSKEFTKALIETSVKDVQDFMKRLDTFRAVYGAKAKETAEFISKQMSIIVHPETLSAAKKVFDELIQNFDILSEKGVDIDSAILDLIEHTKVLHDKGVIAIRELIRLWNDWYNRASGLEDKLPKTKEKLEESIPAILIKKLEDQKISMSEFYEEITKFIKEQKVAPDYAVALEFLRNQGKTLFDLIRNLRTMALLGDKDTLKYLNDYFQLYRVMNMTINILIQAAKEGKISYTELIDIIRQWGEHSDEWINKITSSMTRQQTVVEALKDAMHRFTKDTKTSLEVMSDAFYNMANALSKAFTDTFVKIMKGQIKDLGDVWKNFLIEMVSLWQEALAKMLLYKIVTWLAPGGGAGGGFVGMLLKALGFAKGGIIPGSFIPFQKFAYGGVVKQPTIGLIAEKGQPEAVVPLAEGKYIPVKMLEEKRQTPIHIINILDPRLVGEYLATPMGQKMVLNVISTQAPKVRKLLFGW